MVTSDFKPEVEIWPFCACAVQNTLLPLFMAECPKFSRHTGNRAEEHDGDVRFQTGSRNMAVSRMRSEKYAIKRSIYGGIAEIPHPI